MLQRGDVLGVVMVGGSTRMPMVRRAVADFFGDGGSARVLTDLNPDEVVAIGAAIQAMRWPAMRRAASCCCST